MKTLTRSEVFTLIPDKVCFRARNITSDKERH